MRYDPFAPEDAITNLGLVWLCEFLNALPDEANVGNYADYDIEVVDALTYRFGKRNSREISDFKKLRNVWLNSQKTFAKRLCRKVDSVMFRISELSKLREAKQIELSTCAQKRDLERIEHYQRATELYTQGDNKAEMEYSKAVALECPTIQEQRLIMYLNKVNDELRRLNYNGRVLYDALQTQFEIRDVSYAGNIGVFRVRLMTAEERKHESAEPGVGLAVPVT